MKAWALALGLACAGCGSTPPLVVESLASSLEDLQMAERELLPLLPAEGTRNFGTPDRPVELSPREGWRLLLQAWQARAAGLLAWAKGEPFEPPALPSPRTP